jgi:hypothetical protein
LYARFQPGSVIRVDAVDDLLKLESSVVESGELAGVS